MSDLCIKFQKLYKFWIVRFTIINMFCASPWITDDKK